MNKREVEKVVSEVLRRIGVPIHLKGYNYWRYILVESILDSRYLSSGITKLTYPDCAAKFNTTSSRVERSCRHAIERAFSNGYDVKYFEEVFGTSISYDKGKVTNSQFLFSVVDYIKINYFM